MHTSKYASPVSIITLSVKPRGLFVVRDCYNRAKLKVHFRDGAGREYRYVSMTDLGFYGYAVAHAGDDVALDRLNEFVHSQDEVFVRIGLSREYTFPDGRRGFWVQANGIYTFPDYPEDIRCHRTD